MSKIWLNQPGDYSGDTWHIAAALLLNPNLRVFQTISDAQREACSHSLKARAFYASIGLGDRVDVLSIPGDLGARLRQSRVTDRIYYNLKNVKAAEEKLRQRGIVGEVLPAVEATRFLLRAIRQRGADNICTKVRDAFCRDFAELFPAAADQIRQLADSVPERSLLIIGRYATYHQHYNAGAEVLFRLVRIAQQTHREPVMIADRQIDLAIQETKDLRIRWIDPFAMHPSVQGVWGTRFVTQQSTAYLWRLLGENSRDRVVVGGRGGFTDIAALMGMRVVQWDSFDFLDPESRRLANMSPALCSTIDTSGPEGWDGRRKIHVRQSGGKENIAAMATTDAMRRFCADEFKHAIVEFDSEGAKKMTVVRVR
jgi:hypothetical protein